MRVSIPNEPASPLISAPPRMQRDRFLQLLNGGLCPVRYARHREPIPGPGGSRFHWSWPMGVYFVLGPRPFPYLTRRWYLVVGLNCRVLFTPPNRLVVSRHIKVHSKDIVRLGVYDTETLQRMRPSDWPRRPTNNDPVFARGGPLGSIDVPLSSGSGQFHFRFPSAFRGIPDLSLPASLPGGSRSRVVQLICIPKPGLDEIEIVRLAWWDQMGYGRVITRLAKDSATGHFVAVAVGTKAFLIGPTGGFAGWLA